MPTNSYDVIAVSDDFAGLVAATLCARRGLRVLLLSSGERPARYSVGDYKLPCAPLPLIGMSSPAVRRVLDELHFVHPLKRKLIESRPSFQFVSPEARIDVEEDEVALVRELERELGYGNGHAAACERAGVVSRLFDPVFSQEIALPPIGFWERREIARTAGKLEEEARRWSDSIDGAAARAMLDMPSVAWANCDLESLSPEARLRCFDQWRQGTPRLSGDWTSMRDVFLDKFASHNGEVRVATPSELTFGWGKVTGVRLEEGEELGASHLVAAMPVADLLELSGKKATKDLRKAADGIEVAGYRYTLHLVVDEAGIPEGMARTALVVSDLEAPLTGANAMSVYVDEPDDQARVLVSVEARCPVPDGDRSLDDEMADLRVGIRERLELVMPFLSEHVLLAHSPHESAPAETPDGPIDVKRPMPAPPIWRSHLESVLGVTALPYSMGIKHLSMASTQVIPQLGLEGQFLAGYCAAKLACASSGKRKDYLKDEVISGSPG